MALFIETEAGLKMKGLNLLSIEQIFKLGKAISEDDELLVQYLKSSELVLLVE
jgi:hypothetical protein